MANETERVTITMPTTLAERIRKCAPGGNVTRYLNDIAEDAVLRDELDDAADQLLDWAGRAGALLVPKGFGDLAA